jgi:hypothetical protein
MEFPVDPDRVVLGVLSASLVLGLHLVYLNVVSRLHARKSARIVPNTMVAASIFQLLNQIGFVFFSNASVKGWVSQDQEPSLCYLMFMVGDVVYVTFQLLSTSVLIYNGTVLFTSYGSSTGLSPMKIRIFLSTIMLVALVVTFFSAIEKNILVAHHQCIPLYHSTLNAIGKIMFCALYVLILIFFCVPVLHHVKAMGPISFMTDSSATWKRAVGSMTLRISIPVVGYLITATLAFTGVWGSYVMVQFTLENYLCLLASTFARNAQPDRVEGSSYLIDSQVTSNATRKASARLTQTEAATKSSTVIESLH